MVNTIKLEVSKKLKSLSKWEGVTTNEVRDVSLELFNNLENKNIDLVLMLCQQLLDERKWALNIIAYDWAYRVRKQYNSTTFSIFEKWVTEYLSDWDDCDDFCTHALGELLSQNNDLFKQIFNWTKSPKYVVRRGAAVVLIYPIRKGKYHGFNPLIISDALMNDEHYLVLKGYGWMLKVLSQVEPEKVYEYLIQNKSKMPRLAFRYAIEKFDEKTKQQLMNE